MTFTRTALAAVLLAGVAGISVPAGAQQQQAQAAAPKIAISAGARKAITELQTAVNAKDVANIPAKVAAANAAAKTKEDRYVVGQLQLKAAVDANSDAQKLAAIDAILASGAAPADLVANLRINQGKLKFAAKDYAGASAAGEALIAANPNDIDAYLLLAETRHKQGRTAEAVPFLQKAMAAQKAAGQPVREEVLKRAVAFAFEQKMPAAAPLALEWVSAYPSAKNWRDAISVYETTTGVAEEDKIDLMRLSRAAGALNGESDFYKYASTMSAKGYPGEVKAVLDEGFAANKINRSKPIFRDVYAAASGKVAADKASLPAAERTALAGAAARPAMVTGDAYLGYGEYAKAAALYRAALGKSGVDANLANLRLGIALARAGDKAGATAALNAVSGPRASIAKLWTAWVNRKA